MHDSFKEREQYWRLLFKFLPIPLGLWVLEFFLQYQWLTGKHVGASLVRSFALAGSTLIASALFSSILFKWKPKLARHWRIRRYLGVSGFVLIALHVLSVFHYVFDYHWTFAFYTYNPIENALVFGAVAFIIFFAMAVTSTDWAMQKLSPKRWKNLHRTVYVAEIATVFHVIFTNAQLLRNPAGYLLSLLAITTVLGQLYWWIRISAKRKFKTKGALVGALLLILVATLIYLEVLFLRK